MTANLEVLPDLDALAVRAADLIMSIALSKPRVAIALSGGSTPRPVYRLLATPPRLEAFPWAHVHWFWGDERFVPPDDPASNYRMAREAMLARAPVPADHIHPMPTVGLSPDAAAEAYERTLKEFYGADRLAPDRPLFDLNLLGLGTNGHTASLFPGMPVLEERQRWVGTMHDPEAGTRITLTYPALESSREVVFLVAGAEKKAVLRKVLDGDQTQPAARLRPQGTLRFLADRAAGSK
jgi:6-phosphogluconolactonase